MLAPKGPLFVPAPAEYDQLRYVYSIFKIDFTEERKEADSSTPRHDQSPTSNKVTDFQRRH